MTTSEEIARAARGCVGARFRAQGRGAEGLDCVGVAALAYRGRLQAPVPADYAQRGGDADAIGAAIERAGLRPVAVDAAGEGDLLLLATGPGQWHFAVLTGDGFVHADARLRRVVETPGRPEWPVAGAWRLAEGEG
jgi:lipoprotein Spr